jgi:hypothetical protein
MVLDDLYRRVARARMNILMEEPCPMYEPEWENTYGTQNEQDRTRNSSNKKRMSGDDR